MTNLTKCELKTGRALHEVMEQQTVSVAKGGIIATLNARTSIFAAANPVDGKYDPYKNILDNVALPIPLMTRFDLIFIIRDEPDPGQDETVAKHILDMRAKSSFPEAPPIEFELLKKYIIYAKKLDPEFTEEASTRLSSILHQAQTRVVSRSDVCHASVAGRNDQTLNRACQTIITPEGHGR